MSVITYPCANHGQTMLVKGAPVVVEQTQQGKRPSTIHVIIYGLDWAWSFPGHHVVPWRIIDSFLYRTSELFWTHRPWDEWQQSFYNCYLFVHFTICNKNIYSTNTWWYAPETIWNVTLQHRWHALKSIRNMWMQHTTVCIYNNWLFFSFVLYLKWSSWTILFQDVKAIWMMSIMFTLCIVNEVDVCGISIISS